MDNTIRGDDVRYGRHIYLDAVSEDLVNGLPDEIMPASLLEHWHDGNTPMRHITVKQAVRKRKDVGELVFAIRLIDDHTCVGLASFNYINVSFV